MASRACVNVFSTSESLSGDNLYEIVVLCHTTRMASSSKTRNSRVFTISFPEDLARQVEAVAKEESRNISELFREAFRAYRMERNDRKLFAARAEAAAKGPLRYTEDDIEAIVDEIRSDNFKKRKKTA